MGSQGVHQGQGRECEAPRLAVPHEHAVIHPPSSDLSEP